MAANLLPGRRKRCRASRPDLAVAERQPLADQCALAGDDAHHALDQEQLRAIIVVYNLTHSVTDLETLTDQELIAWIVGAVRDRLAA